MNSAAGAALAIFVAVFAVATLRGVHVGLLMFVSACLVGTTVAGMTLREVIAGFPVNILILVAGVTFFFGIATLNGTIDLVLGRRAPNRLVNPFCRGARLIRSVRRTNPSDHSLIDRAS